VFRHKWKRRGGDQESKEGNWIQRACDGGEDPGGLKIKHECKLAREAHTDPRINPFPRNGRSSASTGYNQKEIAHCPSASQASATPRLACLPSATIAVQSAYVVLMQENRKISPLPQTDFKSHSAARESTPGRGLLTARAATKHSAQNIRLARFVPTAVTRRVQSCTRSCNGESASGLSTVAR